MAEYNILKKRRKSSTNLKTHIYTIEPQTKHEQWKWAMALNEAVTGVAWSNSRNFVGTPSCDRLTKKYSSKAQKR